MYLVVINVPFRGCGPGAAEVASDWGRSLELLRDSFHGRFGRIVVAAPELPPGDGPIAAQEPYRLEAERDDIAFVRLGDKRWRARDFWWHRRAIRARCRHLARQAEVVHAGIGNLWQPYAYYGFRAGLDAGATTVFVQDTDIVQQIHDLTRGQSLAARCRARAYCTLYERVVRRAVQAADLALLKGSALHARYGRHARNARDFYDTSYSAADIISADEFGRKAAAVATGGATRLLALGRLVARKGLDHTLRALAGARAAGAAATLDIIGDGDERPALERLAAELGLDQIVRFLGMLPYGAELIRDIGGYHALVFTPLAEDTPRSLFDALAGGCALICYDLSYTRQVLDDCGHGVAVAMGDHRGLAAQLLAVDRDRARLVAWMQAAHAAAPRHTAEAWYERRAEWTIGAAARGNVGAARRDV